MLGHSRDAVRGAGAIRDSNERLLESCGRSHHRLQVPHLAPLPPSLRPHRGVRAERAACTRRPQGRAWGSDLRSGRVRGAVVRARDARASSESVELLGRPRRPPPPYPLVNPKPPRCASVERWCGSLSGGGRVDLTTYPQRELCLQDCLHRRSGAPPHAPRPVCVLPRPALRAARHAEALRGGPPRRRSRREGGGGACLRACGQSMRAKVMEAARTVCTLVAVLPRAHAHG